MFSLSTYSRSFTVLASEINYIMGETPSRNEIVQTTSVMIGEDLTKFPNNAYFLKTPRIILFTLQTKKPTKSEYGTKILTRFSQKLSSNTRFHSISSPFQLFNSVN